MERAEVLTSSLTIILAKLETSSKLGCLYAFEFPSSRMGQYLRSVTVTGVRGHKKSMNSYLMCGGLRMYANSYQCLRFATP